MKKISASTLLFLLLPLALFAGILFRAAEIESRAFNEEIDRISAAGWIEDLAGKDFEGRQSGTEGGRKASEYIQKALRDQGIRGFDGKDGYIQTFDTITPLTSTVEFSMVGSRTGETVVFDPFEDFAIQTDGYGGPIDYRGEILFLDQSLYEVPGDLIRDRVVVLRLMSLSEETIQYVLDKGGLGILFYPDDYYSEAYVGNKSVAISGKKAETMFIAQITRKTYETLLAEALTGEIKDYTRKRVPGSMYMGSTVGVIEHAVLRLDIDFPLTKGENLIGWIPAPGSDEYLVWAAHYDSFGAYGEDGFVSGAIDNASGVAALLGLSQNLKEQERPPSQNIVFLFLDGENLGALGMGHYLDHPAFPLEKSEFILLDGLGWKGSEEIWIGYDAEKESRYSAMLAEKIFQHYRDSGIPAVIDRSERGGSLGALHDKKLTAIKITSLPKGAFDWIWGTPGDTAGQWDAGKFEEAMAGCLNFLGRTQYGILYPDYVASEILWGGLAALLLIYMIYAVSLLYSENPAARLAFRTADEWYFSLPYMLGTRFLYLLTPILTALLFIVFIVNIPPFFNFAVSPGGVKSNFSAYFVMKQAYSHLAGFGPEILEHSWNGEKASKILPEIFAGSAVLVAAAMTIAFFVGIAKGIFDGMRREGGFDIRGTLSVSIFSIPEVLIALAALYFIVPLSNMPWVAREIGMNNLRLYVMPVISLSLIPSVYFSRLIRIAVEEEKKKVYVRHAKALGEDSFHIVTRHMLKGILIKGTSGIPALAAMILSNLIVVEYLFGYPGMISYLFSNRSNPEIVLVVCMLIGALYLGIVVLSRIFGAMLSPKGDD